MMKKKTEVAAAASPYRTILVTFLGWKVFLLAIAAGSALIGDAYDTSASLALLGVSESASASVSASASSFDSTQNNNNTNNGPVAQLITRLSSWDAIYFVSVARRGYRFEQEWAFGSGLPVVIRSIIKCLDHLGLTTIGDETAGREGSSALPEAIVGVLVSHAAHLLSALVLYQLSVLVWRRRLHALVASILHILSPAGLFLSAPFAESSFALLSFTGYLLLAKSCHAEQHAARRDVYVVLAGVSFGLATAFRSNGILNGIPFAWGVVQSLPTLSRRPSDTLRRLVAFGISGICVAAGLVAPQAVAYHRYCYAVSPGSDAAVWCHGYLPSIYAYVQEHYWNVGFLRYWTLPNLPLFLLAGPMLVILTKSGMEHLTPGGPRPHVVDKPAESARLLALVRSAAVAQVLLAVLAVSNYHVQIITRISSGCPLWYCWLADSLISERKFASRVVMFMVIYASVQGALFSSFLPPA
ncbi:glycosyltransferase family 76 protein [Cercophora scortea]|uniref:GPI mannosyltransferase 2 n=1 Tax=Cercophora scortea TaxID=314031 RepID=A0AAE0MIS6_9PEZI|nr:glycosyltransferase family 76 protein [Cercophora scortea]